MKETEYLLLVDGMVLEMNEYFRLHRLGYCLAGPVWPSHDKDWLIRDKDRLIRNFYRGGI